MGWNTDRNKYSKPETTDQQKNIFIFLKIIVFYLMFTSRHLSRLAHKYYFGILLPMFRYFFSFFCSLFWQLKGKEWIFMPVMMLIMMMTENMIMLFIRSLKWAAFFKNKYTHIFVIVFLILFIWLLNGWMNEIIFLCYFIFLAV